MRKPISFSNGNMGIGKDKTKFWNSNVLNRSKIHLSTSARCQTLDWFDISTSGIKGLILSWYSHCGVYKTHCAVQCTGQCRNIEHCSCWSAHDLFWNSAKNDIFGAFALAHRAMQRRNYNWGPVDPAVIACRVGFCFCFCFLQWVPYRISTRANHYLYRAQRHLNQGFEL